MKGFMQNWNPLHLKHLFRQNINNMLNKSNNCDNRQKNNERALDFTEDHIKTEVIKKPLHWQTNNTA